MELDSPAVLFSALIIGTVGFGMLIYGKKAEDLRVLLAGAVLSIIPFFGHTLLALWGMTAACCAGLWAWQRSG